jgi:hypothetical protein
LAFQGRRKSRHAGRPRPELLKPGLPRAQPSRAAGEHPKRAATSALIPPGKRA